MAKTKGLPLGYISKTVLYRSGMPGVPGKTSGGKTGMFAPNVAAVKDTSWETTGISAPNAAIKSR